MMTMTQIPKLDKNQRSESVLLFAVGTMNHQKGIVPVQVAYYNFWYREWCDNRTGERVDEDAHVGWMPIPDNDSI